MTLPSVSRSIRAKRLWKGSLPRTSFLPRVLSAPLARVMNRDRLSWRERARSPVVSGVRRSIQRLPRSRVVSVSSTLRTRTWGTSGQSSPAVVTTSTLKCPGTLGPSRTMSSTDGSSASRYAPTSSASSTSSSLPSYAAKTSMFKPISVRLSRWS